MNFFADGLLRSRIVCSHEALSRRFPFEDQSPGSHSFQGLVWIKAPVPYKKVQVQQEGATSTTSTKRGALIPKSKALICAMQYNS